MRVLRLDPVLASLAAIHTRDEIREGYFAHDAPQGQTFDERVHWLHRGQVGEVIAWGTGSFGLARGILTLWLASPEHRRILLDPGMRRIGVSVLSGDYQGQTNARVATADLSS